MNKVIFVVGSHVSSMALLTSITTSTQAAILTVGGSSGTYATIQDALTHVNPGDVIEVQGNQTYTGPVLVSPEFAGTSVNPVTLRGIRVGGHRPIISGAGTGWNTMVVFLNASYFVFEGFEVIGDTNADNAGIVHKADHVTIRDVLVHGVAGQGLLGTDADSGSLTLEYSEFYGNGSGTYNHQIYMATDETAYPGSVFRMQFCYVHDGAGGNNVKSRAERNEIYYNWIEGAYYHELDLIGPDGQDPSLAREDSDVVGNVLIKTSEWNVARIGGDGTGDSAGRYRFVNNTMVLSATSDAFLALQQTVQSLEMYNNVLYSPGQGSVYTLNDATGTTVFSGGGNWVRTGVGTIPTAWVTTVSGSTPGWVNASAYDYHPTATSPLVNAGTTQTSATGSTAFVSPLLLPAFVPPPRQAILPGTEEARTISGLPDIGAFESGSAAAGGSGTTGGASGNPATGGTRATGGGTANGGSGATGGKVSSTGGKSSSTGGNASSTGGKASSSTGGTRAVGGNTSLGGSQSAGGAASAGGSQSAGGSLPGGGSQVAGGTAAPGGSQTSGGNPGAGGFQAFTGGAVGAGGTSRSSSGGTLGLANAGSGASVAGAKSDTGGCSCSVIGETPRNRAWWSVALAAVFLLRTRSVNRAKRLNRVR